MSFMQTSSLANDGTSASLAARREDMVSMHRPYLVRFASRRLRDPALVEDMVQETLLAALQGAPGFERKASFRTWLTGILLRRIADHLRRENRRPRFNAPDPAPLDLPDGDTRDDAHDASIDTHDPPRLLEGRQSLDALARCLDALPAIAARVLTLREVHGLSNEQAARELGIAPSHASLILHRARTQLRRCVDEVGAPGRAVAARPRYPA